MIDLVLTRVQLDPNVTIGELTIAGRHICWVCEDAVREVPGEPVHMWKVKGATAIPYGRYLIKRTFSNRFQRTMPQLMDVPGFEGIRIHAGNTSVDTEGCLLPGLERHAEGVGSSALAVLEVEKWLDAIDRNNDEAWIVVKPLEVPA